MEKIILTLTTVPDRLKNKNPYGFKAVIYSLMTQAYENYEVHLNIPKINKKTGEEYIIPEWLEELNNLYVRRNVLRIFRTDDYGPITKLYPTIKRIQEPETIIIVLDDDLIYDSRMIEEHLRLRKEDNEVVWAFAGLNALDNFKFAGIERFVCAVNEKTRVSIVEHYKTVSYTRKMFDDDFNEDFISKGWADDEVVSAYIGMKKIKKYVGKCNYIPSWETEEEWRKYGIVESFPVVNRCEGHGKDDGCYLYRIENLDKIEPEISEYLRV